MRNRVQLSCIFAILSLKCLFSKCKNARLSVLAVELGSLEVHGLDGKIKEQNQWNSIL